MTETLTKWVEALRSGEYRQGTLRLCRVTDASSEKKYCCLGVLAEVAGLELVPDDLEPSAFGIPGEEGIINTGTLPDRLFEELTGLDPNYQSKLADLNDAGHDFEEIADMIEGHLLDITDAE